MFRHMLVDDCPYSAFAEEAAIATTSALVVCSASKADAESSVRPKRST
jgi:hypothetical protein